MNHFGIVLLIAFALIQASQCGSNGELVFKWGHTSSEQKFGNFRHDLYEIEYYDVKEESWYVPKYPCQTMFDIDGVRIPKHWSTKWGNVKMAVDHDLELGYWWRWPKHMVHIVLESDFKYRPNSTFFDIVHDALTKSVETIVKNYGQIK